MADVVLFGSFLSAANSQVHIQPVGGGSSLYVAIQNLKLDDEIDPVLVQAMGSYGSIGATDGQYKPNGEITMPVQEAQYFRDQLSARHSNKSWGLVIFNLTVTVSNGVDPSYDVEARKCRAIKANDDFVGGDPKALVNTMPLLVIDGIYRNGNRIINPLRTQGIQ